MEKQTKNLVIIDTGANLTHANAKAMPKLYSNLKITEDGELHRLGVTTESERSYLGIRELPLSLSDANPARITKDLLYEANRTQTLGVFADFERMSHISASILREFDRVLHENGIPLYVPIACADVVQHAIITFETSISGGSLSQYIEQLQQTYGEKRLASFIRPVSNDFMVPSDSPDGKPILKAEREDLLRTWGAEPYFSKELCAKYFTYTDAMGEAHFVLFDDGITMLAKLSLLAGFHIDTVFILDQDAPPLLRQM